jgi:hypothetical protein
MLLHLRAADTLDKFARVINYSPAGLAFILYKMPDAAKYSTFTVPKASGGSRTIHAPTEKLKRLQRRLAAILQECNEELYKNTQRHPLSHGFEVGRSIIITAKIAHACFGSCG